MENDFDGVFRFSNNDEEDFVALWNNKEYVFPAKTRSPIIIPDETPERIQEIRKKWAYKWAEKMWFKSDEYKRLSNMENFRGGRDDKQLEALIQMCLDPLPVAKATVRPGKSQEVRVKASKPLNNKNDPNAPVDDPAMAFKDDPIETIGAQPDTQTR